jgi:tRNA threonylcarbamoyladenosine modification (KEOPS) complex  Pcc1 subunit
MKINCKLILEFENEKIAKTVYSSVKIDDLDFVKSMVENRKIVAKIKSNSIGSLLHTLDDYLACIGVAEKVAQSNK